MKIQHVSHSDLSGGAARAAYRLHIALSKCGQSSRMVVQQKLSDNTAITGPKTYLNKLKSIIRIFIGEQLVRLQQTNNQTHHTSSWLPIVDNHFQKLAEHADITHLHWFRETPSITTLGRTKQPIVWTLHDMWAFCGAEHLAANNNVRWQTGYSAKNRLPNHKGLDIDLWTWKRKKKLWQRPFHIVTPSRWLESCVSESALMHDWPVCTIPNPIDTDIFRPLDKFYARHLLNLPQKSKLILFGAINGATNPNKGFDLFCKALCLLDETTDYTIVIFGQGRPEKQPNIRQPIKWMGYLYDELTLALLYNAADIMVVPSRQENLPQTGTEAQACGCPVVAFNTTGLPDVVGHKKTGYLARPFEPRDLAYGIQWVLCNEERYNKLALSARDQAVKRWALDVVVPQYIDIYHQAIEQQSLS